MPCYHPLKAFTIGETENGKRKLKVVPYGVDYLALVDRPNGRQIELCNGEEFWSAHDIRHYTEWCQIPCGHCVGCRMEYSRQWADRMILESLDHQSNIFLTLTYDDESLVARCQRQYNINADNISSVIRINEDYYSKHPNIKSDNPINKLDTNSGISYSLVKRDFQLFMKRLRKRFPNQKIRFYACGEYGSQTLRPHFHAIIFGLDLNDRYFWKFNHEHQPLYRSPTLEEIWPYGFALFGDVTWQTCAYTARYVMKKRGGDLAKFYETFNLEPEFCLMSRKPGIARKYYDEHHKDFYETGKILLSDCQGRHLDFKPPHYFDTLYDVENPERLEEIKENRKKIAQNMMALKLSKTSLSLLEYLAVEEYNFTHKVKRLQRSGV